jgi:hypothetical protein
MNKNLSLLKQEFFDISNVPITSGHEGILKYLIPVLEDNEKKTKELSEKVKKLEQAQTFFPFTEEELLKEKIGGTD